MYIEIHDWKEFEQKVLYFKLNNCLNLNTHVELSYKVAGIYAIYKDDVCLYVGQSRNLASRLATHLKGKYENCTNIYAWDIEDIGFSTYREEEKEYQQLILENSEKHLMTVLKPIENLDIDMSFKCPNNFKPLICMDSSSTYTIQNDSLDLKITDSYPHLYEELVMRIDWFYSEEIISQEHYDLLKKELDRNELKYFYDIEV